MAGTSSSVPPTQAQVAPQEGNDRPDLALLDTAGVSLKVRHIALLQSMKQQQQQQQQLKASGQVQCAAQVNKAGKHNPRDMYRCLGKVSRIARAPDLKQHIFHFLIQQR